MKQKISKQISYWLGVIAVGLIAGLGVQFARAWTEPTIAPPGGNLNAPINTSNNGQYKEGNLIVATNNIDPVSGLPRANGLIVANGNVGIGTVSPSEKLHVVSESRPNVHYSRTDGAVIEGEDVSLQIIGKEGSEWKSHIILSGSPDSGDNKHWFVSGWGPTSNDHFGIQHMTSAATDFYNPDSTNDFFTITTTGNVGIGTTNPQTKLEVNGLIKMWNAGMGGTCGASTLGAMFYDTDGTYGDVKVCRKNGAGGYEFKGLAWQ